MVKKIKATTLGKKAVMTNEDLQAYLEGDFKQSVIDFNNNCGKGFLINTLVLKYYNL